MQGKGEEPRRVLSLLNHSRAGWAGWEREKRRMWLLDVDGERCLQISRGTAAIDDDQSFKGSPPYVSLLLGFGPSRFLCSTGRKDQTKVATCCSRQIGFTERTCP